MAKKRAPRTAAEPTPAASEPSFSAAQRRRFLQQLEKWYHQHGRELPWRLTRDPYRIWISEIMLQQTTVVAVIPYFTRFLDRFPTVHELAAAEESEVLRYWEGLGYYSRARNIHKAARQVVAERDGHFPETVVELQALPGIGRYTAGAIRSFAFNLPAPIVEANTLRLYCRLLGYEGDPRSREGQQLLWSFAESLVPADDPGRCNQALMELGGAVCTPASPACSECPVSFACRAYQRGLQNVIPRPAVRPEITAVTELSVVVKQADTYLLYHRAPGERWAGLWDFPRFGGDDVPDSPHQQSEWLQQTLAARLGLEVRIRELLTELRHSVTRYRITLRTYHADYSHGSINPAAGEYRWVSAVDLRDYPLSVTGRKLAGLLPGHTPRAAGTLALDFEP